MRNRAVVGNFQRMGTLGVGTLDLACMVYGGTGQKYFLHTPNPALVFIMLPHT